MSLPTSHAASAQVSYASHSSAREVWYGILIGIVPLLLLAVFTTIAVVLTAMIRQMFAANGFFVWQRASLIALIASLGLAVLVYGISLVLVMRNVTIWQQNGLATRSAATLWTLLLTACMVILPVILVFVLPQAPAP